MQVWPLSVPVAANLIHPPCPSLHYLAKVLHLARARLPQAPLAPLDKTKAPLPRAQAAQAV